MDKHALKGWYQRRYLPHLDTDSVPQMVTYHLADSLPRSVAENILRETDKEERERHRRFEAILDRGYGSCVLRESSHANIVIDTWKFYDGERYRLLDWCVMPNHIHITYDQQKVQIQRIVNDWKTYSATQIKRLLGTYGDGERFWQAGYFDRYARDDAHLLQMQRYIFLNPVRAGLVDDPFDWPYSSIHEHIEDHQAIEQWWMEAKRTERSSLSR